VRVDLDREFLNPRCRPTFLRLYGHRKAIVTALRSVLGELSGDLLDVGCGIMPYRDLLTQPPGRVSRYVGLDLEDCLYQPDQSPDLRWDGKTIPSENESFDCILMIEVLEHSYSPEELLRETARVLKPGGKLFFTVPFIWPTHDSPHDFWRIAPHAMKALLENAGYEVTKMEVLGGWSAALGQMLGLWVTTHLRFGRRQRFSGAILTPLLTPLVYLLYRIDQKPDPYRDQLMFTGLSGLATKRASS